MKLQRPQGTELLAAGRPFRLAMERELCRRGASTRNCKWFFRFVPLRLDPLAFMSDLRPTVRQCCWLPAACIRFRVDPEQENNFIKEYTGVCRSLLP